MEINEMIEILKCYRDGGEIQFLLVGRWVTMSLNYMDFVPTWDFSETSYRIKPEEPVKLPSIPSKKKLYKYAVRGPDGVWCESSRYYEHDLDFMENYGGATPTMFIRLDDSGILTNEDN